MHNNPVRPEVPGSPLTDEETRDKGFLGPRKSKRQNGHPLTLVPILSSQPHCFQPMVLLLRINVFFFASPHLGCIIWSLTPTPPPILFHQCYTIYILVPKCFVQLLCYSLSLSHLGVSNLSDLMLVSSRAPDLLSCLTLTQFLLGTNLK